MPRRPTREIDSKIFDFFVTLKMPGKNCKSLNIFLLIIEESAKRLINN